MSWPKTGHTYYDVKLGIQDKGCVIKWLVVCFIVWLGFFKGMGLRTCARCVGLVPACCGQIMAIEFKFRNTPHVNIT